MGLHAVELAPCHAGLTEPRFPRLRSALGWSGRRVSPYPFGRREALDPRISSASCPSAMGMRHALLRRTRSWRRSASVRGSAGLRLRTPPQALVHLHAASDRPAPRLASGPLQPDSHSQPVEIRLASLSRVTGRGGVENTQCAPASLVILGRCESCPYLHNAAARLVARDLPVGDKLLQRFQDQQRRAYPEHTGAKRLRRARVVEQLLALFVTGMDVKIIAHHQDDINIIRVGFRGDITPKEDQTFQFARGTGQLIDTPQACCDSLSLRCTTPELRQHLVHRGLMYTFR